MFKSKSNTFFVGYLDKFHIHAGVSQRKPVELVLKKLFALKDLKDELWQIPIAERAFPAPNRAMAKECVVRCGGKRLDIAVVNNLVWLTFVPEVVHCARFFPLAGGFDDRNPRARSQSRKAHHPPSSLPYSFSIGCARCPATLSCGKETEKFRPKQPKRQKPRNTGNFRPGLLKSESNQIQPFSLHTGGLEIPNAGEHRAQVRFFPNRALSESSLRPNLCG